MGNPGLTNGLDLLLVVGKKMHKNISLIYGVFFMVMNPMGPSNPQKKSRNKQSKLLDIHDIHLYNIVYNYTKPKHSMLCAT